MIPHPIDGPATYGIGQASVQRHSTLGAYPDQAPAIARAFALLGASGGLVGLLGILVDHPASFDEGLLIATQAASMVLAIGLFLTADRIPLWVVSLMPPIAVVFTSIAVLATEDPSSGYALFYVWIAIISFYFLTRRETYFNIAWAVLNYAVVTAILGTSPPASNDGAHFFVLLVGTLLAAAVPLFYLRERFDELLQRLTASTRTDPVTGLGNERMLDEALERELARSRLTGCRVSVLIVELDRFKRVAEELGPAASYELLRRIGAMFGESIQPTDTIARNGPSQFTIVAPDVDGSRSYLMAEQLLHRVRRSFRQESVALTASVGIATYPADAAGPGELLKVADRALTAAKDLSGDRAVIYSQSVEKILAGQIDRRPGKDAHTHLATMLGLAEALDLRDSGTAEHSARVGTMAKRIALDLGLSEQRAERVRLAGILHDIGKIGVPDDVLRKPGPLNEVEWVEMRRHPEIAARILGTRELVDIREWILASHERIDGKGYPRGLAGEEIPLESRIISVADAYEAMTEERHYRIPLSPDDALAELHANAGTQFDREVVEVFVAGLDRAAIAT